MERFSPEHRTPWTRLAGPLGVREFLALELRLARRARWRARWEQLRRVSARRFSPFAAPAAGRQASLPRLPEAVEAVAIVAAVVGFGLSWAHWAERAGGPAGVPSPAAATPAGPAQWDDRASLSGAPYPAPAMTTPESSGNAPESGHPAEPTAPHVEEWLVDGYNFLHASLLGGQDRSQWWTAPQRARVLGAVAEAAPAARVTVVFDGDRPAADRPRGAEPGADEPVAALYAPSADEWLVRRVKAADDPTSVAVVTADRRLADRVRHHGARVVAPRDFLAQANDQSAEPSKA